MSCIAPPLIIKPHFMFDQAVCTIHISVSVMEGHAENVDLIFPMPEAMVAAPLLTTTGEESSCVFGNTTKLCRCSRPQP